MQGYDVITLGETMVRLSPPGFRRIEQSTEMTVEVGGSESNVAIGLARLGLRSLWLSRLTANSLGRLIEQQVRRHGVDTSRVLWTDEDRIGLYFLEEGPRPRGSRVIYDRAGSAFSRMRPDELPAEVFGQARHLHLSGITPALGTVSAATAAKALELARRAGATVSFDLNYRRIWSPEQAREGCQAFMRAADLLFVPLGDARLVYEVDTDAPNEVARWLGQQYPQAVIVVTLGADGALARLPDGASLHQRAFAAEPAGRVGGGDAFAAGFLYRYLTAADDASRIAHALRWGAAAAAIKYTVPGDIPFIERGEVEALLAEPARGVGLRR